MLSPFIPGPGFCSTPPVIKSVAKAAAHSIICTRKLPTRLLLHPLARPAKKTSWPRYPPEPVTPPGSKPSNSWFELCPYLWKTWLEFTCKENVSFYQCPEQYSCHTMSAVEGFLCDNATKTGMMIKDPVYVHKHTHTHTHTQNTYIPILLSADSMEKCNKIQEIQNTNTTNKHNLHAPNDHHTSYQKDMYHAVTKLHAQERVKWKP